MSIQSFQGFFKRSLISVNKIICFGVSTDLSDKSSDFFLKELNNLITINMVNPTTMKSTILFMNIPYSIVTSL